MCVSSGVSYFAPPSENVIERDHTFLVIQITIKIFDFISLLLRHGSYPQSCDSLHLWWVPDAISRLIKILRIQVATFELRPSRAQFEIAPHVLKEQLERVIWSAVSAYVLT